MNGWHRQNRTSPATLARRAQYRSPEHRQLRAHWQQVVDAGEASCWRCGKPLAQGSRWHLGHDDHDRTVYRGPECATCNLKAAARAGNRRQRALRDRTRLTW